MKMEIEPPGNLVFKPTGHDCVVVIVMKDGCVTIAEERDGEIYFDPPWRGRTTSIRQQEPPP